MWCVRPPTLGEIASMAIRADHDARMEHQIIDHFDWTLMREVGKGA